MNIKFEKVNDCWVLTIDSKKIILDNSVTKEEIILLASSLATGDLVKSCIVDFKEQ
jgi:hypothetical protein